MHPVPKVLKELMKTLTANVTHFDLHSISLSRLDEPDVLILLEQIWVK